jgi:hypothetical protein
LYLFLFFNLSSISLFYTTVFTMSVKMVDLVRVPVWSIIDSRMKDRRAAAAYRVTPLHHRARNNTAGTIIAAPTREFDTGGDAFDCR